MNPDGKIRCRYVFDREGRPGGFFGNGSRRDEFSAETDVCGNALHEELAGIYRYFQENTMPSNTHKSSGDTSKRGFASMDEDKQREIASKGGKAAHEKGTAHEFTSEEAREAGREGGRVAHERGTAHEFTSEEAREAGREGGKAAHEKGTAHEFTSKEAREAGRKGGEASHGGGHGSSHSSSSGSSSTRGGSS